MIKKVENNNFTIFYDYSEDPHSVKFEVFEITGHEEDSSGKFTVPVYEKQTDGPQSWTNNVKEAANYLNGFVKWDGCSHYNFGDDDGYLHLCGESSIKKCSELIDQIFWECAEIMGLNFQGV